MRGVTGVTGATVVIALSVRSRVIGVVVDSGPDALELTADSIKPALEMSVSVDAARSMGMGCIKSGDVERMRLQTDIGGPTACAETGLKDAAAH